MPLAQSLRLDTEAGVGIEHDEVGVTPGRDPPFAGEPREPGGSFGAPASEIGPGRSACTSNGSPSPASWTMAGRAPRSATGRNSAIPDGTREHLNPRTPPR